MTHLGAILLILLFATVNTSANTSEEPDEPAKTYEELDTRLDTSDGPSETSGQDSETIVLAPKQSRDLFNFVQARVPPNVRQDIYNFYNVRPPRPSYPADYDFEPGNQYLRPPYRPYPPYPYYFPPAPAPPTSSPTTTPSSPASTADPTKPIGYMLMNTYRTPFRSFLKPVAFFTS